MESDRGHLHSIFTLMGPGSKNKSNTILQIQNATIKLKLPIVQFLVTRDQKRETSKESIEGAGTKLWKIRCFRLFV